MHKHSKISKYFVKKIIFHFCVDIEASKRAILTGINRNTINCHFKMFREAIYLKQKYNFEKLFGQVELDESYFGGKRIKGYHGKLKEVEEPKNSLYLAFLKEMEEFIQK